MTGEDRRKKILKRIQESATAVSGSKLAQEMQVSRQVIVQDIALIRAMGVDIYSTSRGYLIRQSTLPTRVYKVHHTPDQVEEEMNLFVDNGARIIDVFVYHKVYGLMRADLNIHSRLDIKNYMKEIESGNSSLLSNVTSGYHYHTVSAESIDILDLIQEELEKAGFLAKLQDYEPVDFWKES